MSGLQRPGDRSPDSYLGHEGPHRALAKASHQAYLVRLSSLKKRVDNEPRRMYPAPWIAGVDLRGGDDRRDGGPRREAANVGRATAPGTGGPTGRSF